MPALDPNFVRRRAKGGKRWQTTTYKRFPKLTVLCDCDSHLILSAVAGRGPGPDITHFERAILEALGRVGLGTLYADAGYDAEWVHLLAREMLDVRTIIPAGIGRPTDKPPTPDGFRAVPRIRSSSGIHRHAL